jgi:hypothetical protein
MMDLSILGKWLEQSPELFLGISFLTSLGILAVLVALVLLWLCLWDFLKEVLTFKLVFNLAIASAVIAGWTCYKQTLEDFGIATLIVSIFLFVTFWIRNWMMWLNGWE